MEIYKGRREEREVFKGKEKRIEKMKKNDAIREDKKTKEKYFISCRNSLVLPNLVGLTLHIYNGRHFIPLVVSHEMVGHKLGAFCPTRKNRAKR